MKNLRVGDGASVDSAGVMIPGHSEDDGSKIFGQAQDVLKISGLPKALTSFLLV
jgi:hypothetical protein